MTKTISSSLTLEDAANGYDQAIICPACGFNYLHSKIVVIYARGEDEKKTLVTTASNHKTTTSIVESCKTNNPSSRRQGISIRFECEGCNTDPELTFAQHKGQTYIRWRADGRGDVS